MDPFYENEKRETGLFIRGELKGRDLRDAFLEAGEKYNENYRWEINDHFLLKKENDFRVVNFTHCMYTKNK